MTVTQTGDFTYEVAFYREEDALKLISDTENIEKIKEISISEGETIKVYVNGEERYWPKAEYLDYKAIQFGFEDYEYLKNHGFHLED